MPLLDIRNLTIEFKTGDEWVKAVDRVSMTLTEGEIRGLVGESGSGKSLIAKAYDLALSHDQMRQLTATGFWPLYRFDPRRADEGKLPLALDSRPPSEALEETLLHEQRFRRLNSQQPEVAEQLWKDAAADLQKRYDFLAQMAGKAEKSNTD